MNLQALYQALAQAGQLLMQGISSNPPDRLEYLSMLHEILEFRDEIYHKMIGE